jgi:hypothetical protein
LSCNHSSARKVPKTLAKHIRTKVSFKVTLWDRHVYIRYTFTLIRHRYYSWHIWNYVRTKIIVLPLFHFSTRLNSQNPHDNEIQNEFCHINFNRDNGISNWHIWSINPMKKRFLFISVPYKITDLQTPETLEYITRGAKWSDVKTVFFSSSKC